MAITTVFITAQAMVGNADPSAPDENPPFHGYSCLAIDANNKRVPWRTDDLGPNSPASHIYAWVVNVPLTNSDTADTLRNKAAALIRDQFPGDYKVVSTDSKGLL